MIGTQVGQFQVLKLLGEGGMGSVYLAEHVVLKKLRALKMLRAEWTQNQNILRRFINEARAAASLEHRNIIPVHDFGTLSDGKSWFMVMDYLDGSTLNQFLYAHKSPPPLHVCLQILVQIANGLTAAHRGGIIHRDLKPDNIFLVARDPNPYHVVILDFGVAKLSEQLPSGALTRTSAVVGTPAYTAAEQLRGGAIDARVDLFSLGVIAYQMVTGGWLPFQNTASRNEYYNLTAAELYHRQMTQSPVDPRTHVPDLPEAWASIILSALHRDPAQRPADLHEFAIALAHATPGNAFQPNGMVVLETWARELLQTDGTRATIRAPSGSQPIIRSSSIPIVPVVTAPGPAPIPVPDARSGPAAAVALAPTTPAGPVATPNAARYKLGAKLGTGGMAEVFVGTASGAEGFTRTVAIKRVLPGLSEVPTFATMFVQEARIACRLSHPNIVTVFDFDRDAEGRLFLAMEFVEGRDLTALLASGPVPVSVAIFLAIEMLRGLGYAHDLPNSEGGTRGVVHRDVSPQNVLLSWEGAVKVSDFGLAKALDASAGSSGTVKGKVAWMSPEQANAEPLDGRTDLWAVGVILWELLAGESLFKGTFTEVIAQVMFREIPMPRDVPADVAAVLKKLLMRPRDSRYANAEEAIHDLAACRDCPRDGRSELMRVLADRFPREAHTQLAAPTPRRRNPDPLPSSPPNSSPPNSSPPNVAAAAVSEVVSHKAVTRRWLWPVVTSAVLAASIAGFAIFTQRPHSSRTQLAVVVPDASLRADAAAPMPPPPVIHDAIPDAAVVVVDAAPPDTRDAAEPVGKQDETPPELGGHVKKPSKQGERSSSHSSSGANSANRKSAARERGDLDVTVLRSYAEVYVDSSYVGTTPVHIKLPVGPHRITLVNTDIKQRSSMNVVITTTEPVTIEKPW